MPGEYLNPSEDINAGLSMVAMVIKFLVRVQTLEHGYFCMLRCNDYIFQALIVKFSLSQNKESININS